MLVRAGEAAPGLMLVLSGGITITPDPENAMMATGFLDPGEYVELGSLLTRPPQPDALVAQKNTRLLVLPPSALETLLSTEPELGMRFYRAAAEHLVQTLAPDKPGQPPPDAISTEDIPGNGGLASIGPLMRSTRRA